MSTPRKSNRPRSYCDKCRTATRHYVYPREHTVPVMACVPCKSAYMAKRYAADRERYKRLARQYREGNHR